MTRSLTINRRQFVVAAVAALVIGFGGAGVASANPALHQQAAPSVVWMPMFNAKGQVIGYGSGFVVDVQNRLVATAAHVVDDPNGNPRPSIDVFVCQTQNGKPITDPNYYLGQRQKHMTRGKVVYFSQVRDMAIVQVDQLPAGVKALPLAAAPAQPGETVHVIGSSNFDLGEQQGGLFGYSSGKVRAVIQWKHGKVNARAVCHDVPDNHGDSGGPVLNDRGEVVGFIHVGSDGTGGFGGLAVTDCSICVSEIRLGLEETLKKLQAR